MTIEASKNTCNIYACGGVGINILSILEAGKATPIAGFARYNTIYIDTSRSNLIGKNVNQQDVFLFEGKDGSGSVRKSNYPDITKHIPAILNKFKPTSFNIVIASAGGGSGSVISSALVSELLKTPDKDVVLVLVGTSSSVIAANNTTQTLEGLEKIAEIRDRNVNLAWLQNSATVNDEAAVNMQATQIVSMLLGLFSGEHQQLDTADVKSLLNVNRVTGDIARVSNLIVAQGPTLKPMHPGAHFVTKTPVAVATLATRDMPTVIEGHTPILKFDGYIPSSWTEGAHGNPVIRSESVHYCIDDDKIGEIYKSLSNQLEEARARNNVRVRGGRIGGDSQATSDGLVL